MGRAHSRSAHFLNSLLGYADGWKGRCLPTKLREYNVHVNVPPACLSFHPPGWSGIVHSHAHVCNQADLRLVVCNSDMSRRDADEKEDDEDDGIHEQQVLHVPPSHTQQVKRPLRLPWTAEDEERLRDGVLLYGTPHSRVQWEELRGRCGLIRRSGVDLRGKWRNMVNPSATACAAAAAACVKRLVVLLEQQEAEAKPQATAGAKRKASAEADSEAKAKEDDEDDGIHEQQVLHVPPSHTQQVKRPLRLPWTAEDEERLRDGVLLYGTPHSRVQWEELRGRCGLIRRSGVDLRGKWRNMVNPSATACAAAAAACVKRLVVLLEQQEAEAKPQATAGAKRKASAEADSEAKAARTRDSIISRAAKRVAAAAVTAVKAQAKARAKAQSKAQAWAKQLEAKELEIAAAVRRAAAKRVAAAAVAAVRARYAVVPERVSQRVLAQAHATGHASARAAIVRLGVPKRKAADTGSGARVKARRLELEVQLSVGSDGLVRLVMTSAITSAAPCRRRVVSSASEHGSPRQYEAAAIAAALEFHKKPLEERQRLALTAEEAEARAADEGLPLVRLPGSTSGFKGVGVERTGRGDCRTIGP